MWTHPHDKKPLPGHTPRREVDFTPNLGLLLNLEYLASQEIMNIFVFFFAFVAGAMDN